MVKAYNLLLRVLSAEIKLDKDVVLTGSTVCSVMYAGYKWSTGKKIEGDEKAPKWKDEFEITYFEKGPVTFELMDQTSGDLRSTLICRGELDLTKKVLADGEVEVALKSDGSKGEPKKAGVLKISLKWLGDFDLVPFRMELVLHTADLSKFKDARRIGAFQLVASMDEGTKFTTDEVDPNYQGHAIFKARFKAVITTQESVTIRLQNEVLKQDGFEDPWCKIPMDAIKLARPGTMKKFWLEGMMNGKIEKYCLVYILINHNFKPRLDPKDSKYQLEPSQANIMNTSQEAKFHNQGMSKTELRKKIYEEFKSQKKKKLSLKAMDDRQKETFLAEQEAALENLRTHKLNLREHLDLLEDKMDDTLAKMRDRKRKDEDNLIYEYKSEGALELRKKDARIKELKKESEKLKEEFSSGSGFDKLKELENTKGMHLKSIKDLREKIDAMEKEQKSKRDRCRDIQEKNKVENNRLTEELNSVLEELRQFERESEKRADLSKSLNAANLTIKQQYREKMKANHLYLSSAIDGEVNPNTYDLEGQRYKPPKKQPDKRLRNPIWRAIHEEKQKEQQELPDTDKRVAALPYSEASAEELVNIWKQCLSTKQEERQELKREGREMALKQRTIIRLETQINDKKNVNIGLFSLLES